MKVFLLLALFLIFRWVFLRIILPVFKLTRMTHQKMNEMQQQMNQQKNHQFQRRKDREIDGEYIDYEEV